MQDKQSSNLKAGVLAWIATVVIATSWQLATRFGVTTTLTPIDLALLRYSIPAIVLLPVLCRFGFFPIGVSHWHLGLIIIGGGLPFGLLGMVGAQFAPASHMGALLPGSMPVFVALLSVIVLGERLNKERFAGLSAIIVGVLCIVWSALSNNTSGRSVWIGDGLFVSAGVFWAIYTVAYRKRGLTPWHSAALICFWSSILIVPVMMIAPNTALFEASLLEIALQVVAQGILAGLLGLFAYGAAITHLGANIAAVSGAAVPAFTALGGIFLLREPLSAQTGLGILFVACGIWVFAGSPGLYRVFRYQKNLRER